MPLDRFFIGPFEGNSGIQRDLKPFMIMNEAFESLNNAYVFRGRVRKRFGSRWLGDTVSSTRLRILVGTTDSSGDLSDTIPGKVPLTTFGQQFSISDKTYTVRSLGTPTTLLQDGTTTVATFDTDTGGFVFTGAPALSDVYYYPSLPVMGLATFENSAIDITPTIAFDTQFSYSYVSGSGWKFIDTAITPGANIWTGNNSQLFWTTTYVGANAFDYVLFATNFNESEPNYMRFLFNNAGTYQWDNFRPQISATGTSAPIYLDAALILIPFKNRLLAFNTWENENGTQRHYANRMRYSAIGSPLASDAWRQDIDGQGGGLDCPTNEAIVSAQFIKDRLLVFLDQSTWEIVYTGNQIQPFTWQQINTELGVESTFSTVPFDKVVVAIGNLGVIGCTGTNVERIDEKIPDEVFKIHNIDAGIERVYGIRDYKTEMIYWTFPSPEADSDFPFPNRILVYNYKNGTWAFNDDSITAFGYFQNTGGGVLWSSETVSWADDEVWNDGSFNALFSQVIAGNQEGFTFLVDADETTNASALQLTNLTISVPSSNIITLTAIDHNLRGGDNPDYIYIEQVVGTGNLNLLNGKIFAVQTSNPANPDTFDIIYEDDLGTIIAGDYHGSGLLARVSQIQLLTKQYNFYMEHARNAYVTKVDFLVDRTENGEIQVDYFVSTADNSMLADASQTEGTGALLGTGVLETFPYPTVPFESKASQLWHPYYLSADGEFIQLNIQLNDKQMRDPLVREAQFQLHGMIFWASQSSYRPQ